MDILTKKCCACSQTFPISEFAKRKRKGRVDTLQSRCTSCSIKYKHTHYSRNKDRYIAKAKKRNKKQREDNLLRYRELKGNLQCKKCGENHIACLDFHHRNPEEKEFDIAATMLIKWERLLKEIEKCDVLCSNCHRKLHYNERNNIGTS